MVSVLCSCARNAMGDFYASRAIVSLSLKLMGIEFDAGCSLRSSPAEIDASES
jgi:hypothetical protein